MPVWRAAKWPNQRSCVENGEKGLGRDHLYSVAALTNGAGAVVERYLYDETGNRTVLAADGITMRAVSLYKQQTGFTGRYLDKETGLWYFRARYYSGSLGRFIGRDPIEYVDGLGLYGAYFVPTGLDPLGLNRIDGKRATIVSWIAWTPIDKVRQATLDAWINLYGANSVSTTVAIALAGASIALYSGFNPDPSDSMTDDQFSSLISSKEYRSASWIKPWIECDCYDKVNKYGEEAKFSIGYTPQHPVPALRMWWMYSSGNGKSEVNYKVESTCVTFTMKTQFMVNEGEQLGYKLIFGRRLPYAWHQIAYKLCCDETATVEFSGSNFPSHKGYIDGKLAWQHDQTDYGTFGSSGGLDSGSDTDAPGIP